jgi:hypothetical protein
MAVGPDKSVFDRASNTYENYGNFIHFIECLSSINWIPRKQNSYLIRITSF